MRHLQCYNDTLPVKVVGRRCTDTRTFERGHGPLHPPSILEPPYLWMILVGSRLLIVLDPIVKGSRVTSPLLKWFVRNGKTFNYSGYRYDVLTYFYRLRIIQIIIEGQIHIRNIYPY